MNSERTDERSTVKKKKKGKKQKLFTHINGKGIRVGEWRINYGGTWKNENA